MDEFIVIGCDGIWDVMINEEVGDYICLRMLFFDDLKFICSEFFDICLVKVSWCFFLVVILLFICWLFKLVSLNMIKVVILNCWVELFVNYFKGLLIKVKRIVL